MRDAKSAYICEGMKFKRRLPKTTGGVEHRHNLDDESGSLYRLVETGM